MDLPGEYRTFDKLFDLLALRHGYSDVFNDFLNYSIQSISMSGTYQERAYFASKYEEKQMDIFKKMFIEMIHITERNIKSDTGWYDFVGTYYEYIANTSKKQGFGQFFTPQDIVDMMTMITGGDDPGTGKRINDPACGSGRTLISFHAHHPGNFLFGEDLDYTCCLMTVWNMLISGGVGEVVHHNSLMPDSFYHGWRVNEYLNPYFRLTVRSIEKEESYVWRHWEHVKNNQPEVFPKEVEVRKAKNEQTIQLTLF